MTKNFSSEFTIEAVSDVRLPERGGQVIFIENCDLNFGIVLMVFRSRFKFRFSKFILLRCIVKERVCIRFIFFLDKSISSECESYVQNLDSQNLCVVSSFQGPIKKGFHNRAKYFFIKSFCDSGLELNEDNFICSPCCCADAESTMAKYFRWRFDYKSMMLEKEQARLRAKNMSSRNEVLEICRNVEFGMHSFDIECINYQMDIVSNFFGEINWRNQVMNENKKYLAEINNKWK
jgi:hypothetical protein